MILPFIARTYSPKCNVILTDLYKCLIVRYYAVEGNESVCRLSCL